MQNPPPSGRSLATMNRDPGHAEYITMLRSMSPEARLLKAFELGKFSRDLFRHGLRRRFPEKSEAEIREIERARLALCHNRRS